MRVPILSMMWESPWRRLWAVLAALILMDLLWIAWRFPQAARARTCTTETLPDLDLPVLVLGAGVFMDREPSPVLRARLDTALALYRAGKVRWFLVSGDNRAASYNEPQAMQRWLQRQGVPVTLIVKDYAGRRTLDSLKRAQVIFGLRRLVVVTSDFHMPRTLYSARALGLEAWGVPCSTRDIRLGPRVGFLLRELAARHLAVWDAWFPPDTLLGPREPTPEDWLGRPGEAPVP